MSDNLDTAIEKEQYILDRQIQVRKVVPILTWNGLCHYCEESVEQPKLFCSNVCADSYDKYSKR